MDLYTEDCFDLGFEKKKDSDPVTCGTQKGDYSCILQEENCLIVDYDPIRNFDGPEYALEEDRDNVFFNGFERRDGEDCLVADMNDDGNELLHVESDDMGIDDFFDNEVRKLDEIHEFGDLDDGGDFPQNDELQKPEVVIVSPPSPLPQIHEDENNVTPPPETKRFDDSVKFFQYPQQQRVPSNQFIWRPPPPPPVQSRQQQQQFRNNNNNIHTNFVFGNPKPSFCQHPAFPKGKGFDGNAKPFTGFSSREIVMKEAEIHRKEYEFPEFKKMCCLKRYNYNGVDQEVFYSVMEDLEPKKKEEQRIGYVTPLRKGKVRLGTYRYNRVHRFIYWNLRWKQDRSEKKTVFQFPREEFSDEEILLLSNSGAYQNLYCKELTVKLCKNANMKQGNTISLEESVWSTTKKTQIVCPKTSSAAGKGWVKLPCECDILTKGKKKVMERVKEGGVSTYYLVFHMVLEFPKRKLEWDVSMKTNVQKNKTCPYDMTDFKKIPFKYSSSSC